MGAEGGFDRDFTLPELLSPRDAAELCAVAGAVLGVPVAVLDAAGAVYGDGPPPPADAARAPLVVELEPLGFIAAACPPPALAEVARLLRWGLLARARLRMVSDLHLEAVRADYARLQQQNEALKISEAKYRELAASLDAKVREQTQIIDERQRQLYQAERLASIGQLAAGVAHEINNPLGFINSNLSAAERYREQLAGLRDALPAVEWQARDLDFVFADFADLLRDARDGVDRIARIVRDLKGFSSVDQPEEQVVDLNAQLASLLAVVNGQKKATIRLVTDFQPLPKLMCLPGHLNQAFLCILQNALQAVEAAGGTVTVRTRAVGEQITVSIADDGPGIPEDVLPRVFDPFFTTRGVGAGTGLGLTVARDIVLAHGGRIVIDLPLAGGTVVNVELPA